MGFTLSVFGHTTLDYIVNLSRLPAPNTSIEMKDQKRFFGGTGANIARGAATLKVKTYLSSFVGSDFPEDFHKALKDSGVNLKDLQKVEEYLTPMCWILSDPEHNQIAVINQGPVRDSDDFDITPYSIGKGDLIHICTGRPGYFRKVMEEANKQGKKISFDPAQEIHYVYDAPTFTELLGMSTYFFCNESELAKALEYTGKQGPEDLLDNLEALIVTLGSKGSTIYTEKEKMDIPIVPPTNPVLDTTGAGDGYRAGFYAGMSKGMDLYNCGLRGAAASSFVIESMGPQSNLANLSMLEERLSSAGLE